MQGRRMNSDNIAESSSDARFDAIRPYRDDEVSQVISRILSDESFLSSIIRFQFKRFRFLGAVLRPFISYKLRRKFANVTTVAAFQDYVAKFMENMIKSTTDGVSFEGFEKLKKDQGYLFISNHRDIALDPAFIDLGLHRCGLDTVRIAIGDNLLRTQLATDLMKLNQSFVVDRSSKGRELLSSLATLSDYIRLSLSEGHSIWIAQREGRAKDGNDLTDPAILKMFHLAGRKHKIPFNEYIRQLNIVPVAISYEYEPGDADKAHELFMKERDGTYEKSNLEDIESIVNGIRGYKGRITVRVGDPVTQNFENAEELAAYIDSYIHQNYKLYPSNLIAAGEKSDAGGNYEAAFNERLSRVPPEEQKLMRNYYARPVQNSRAKEL